MRTDKMCSCQQINKSGHHLSNTVKFYLAVCPICSLVRKSPDRSRPLFGDETHVSPVFARSPISMSLRICCSWPSSRRTVFSLAWQLMIFIFPSKHGNPWASAVTLNLQDAVRVLIRMTKRSTIKMDFIYRLS